MYRFQIENGSVSSLNDPPVGWWDPVSDLRLVDEDRAIESLLQDGADPAEVRSCFPARLHLAASRHAVALAPHLHARGYHLEKYMKITINYNFIHLK